MADRKRKVESPGESYVVGYMAAEPRGEAEVLDMKDLRAVVGPVVKGPIGSIIAGAQDQAFSDDGEIRKYTRLVAERLDSRLRRVVGNSPSGTVVAPDADVVAAEIVDLFVHARDTGRSELADLVAPVWSAEKTRQELGGLSRQALSERRRTGSLLGLRASDSDTFRYPTFQFERHEGQVRVKPALRTFMMALRHRDPWSVAIIAKTPAPELDDLTPLDWVRQKRDPEDLTRYAGVLNAEYAR